MKPILAEEQKEDYSQLKSVDIVSVIEMTGTALNRAGSIYKANCPLHLDKDTPSFVVYPKTNSWACFSPNCGNGNNGGDAIEFLRQYYHYSFREAIDWLEKHFIYSPAKIEKKTEVKKEPRKATVTPDFITYWHALLGNKREFFLGRGFTDETIDTELFGYDPSLKRLIIPVWDWEPQHSKIIGIRKRRIQENSTPKYIGHEGLNEACVYGKFYCLNSEIILCFAGELDARRAIQDSLPAFSVVNGVNSWHRFPKDWMNLWFPTSSKLIVCFDKKEEIEAGKLATMWAREKGIARVFHYPIDFEGKDYCNWRDSGRTAEEFYNRVLRLFG